MNVLENKTGTPVFSPLKRGWLGALALCLLVLFLGAAASLPFYFPSSSLFYKFGLDKILLRSGKIIGLMAFCSVFLQVVSGTRLKVFDRIFSLNRVFVFHRVSGMAAAVLAILHPVLVMASEDMLFLPLQMRYWPEFTGVFLLIGLISNAIASTFRQGMGLAFHLWYRIHQWVGPVLIALLFVHVLYVSETFETGLPRILVFGCLGICSLLWLGREMRPFFSRSVLEVSSVTRAGIEATRLELVPVLKGRLFYQPGQFGFFRFQSPNVSGEEHPFSLASSPTRPDRLELVIRRNGDWTTTLSRLEPGTRCSMDGPYGLFSHLRCPKDQGLVLIAGGIGITPMLSMIRYMADTGDDRKTLLIWSNKTRGHAFLIDELESMGQVLKNLQMRYWFSRDPETSNSGGRLDRIQIKLLLSEVSLSAPVFVCGPPEMIHDIRKGLLEMGWPKKRIFTERFDL